MTGEVRPPGKQRWLSWFVSVAAGAALLWLASTQLQLWPDELALPRPGFLWVAIALHAPYAVLRATRLSYLLDPVVAHASGDPRRTMARGVIYGSGFVSFLVLLVLPLKLGELSRPLLLVRGRQPGVQLTESLAAVATERIIDGIVICVMLFGGLALADGYAEGVAARVGNVRAIGQGMLGLFGVALLGLLAAARWPERAAGLVGRLGGSMGPRAATIMVRLTGPVAALFDLRRAAPLLATSLLYWAVTALQLWCVLVACGVELGAPEAAAIVAIIGLSIQLPGGPAQAGTFQVGTAAALGLFLTAHQVAGPGSSFAVVMYLLQLVGAAAVALPGLVLVAQMRPAEPAEPLQTP